MPELDMRGVLLAGIIIGSLGVLDDVTVTQVSAVWELKRARPDLSTMGLYRPVVRIGRDHISSTVNTLFLAYAGASLALLVLFSTGGLPTRELVNSEIIATEIVKTVVGSLGLIAAVPLTTALAASVAVRRSPDAPPLGAAHAHGHVHGPGDLAGREPGDPQGDRGATP